MQRVRVSSEQSPVHKLGETQMALTPKFRLGTTTTSSSSSQTPTPPTTAGLPAETEPPLIPGLPDDVALSCLLRVPVNTHSACRSVCRRWRALLSSKGSFFTRRREVGLREPWLFVLAFHKCTGKPQCRVLDLTNLTWHATPPMPCSREAKAFPRGFQCVALPARDALLVCGGKAGSHSDCPLDLALKFHMCSNRWTVVNRMLTPRAFFASCVVDGLVYVAGGTGAHFSELDSAEVFDPADGNWRRIRSMGASMAVYGSAVVDGMFLLTEGWEWPFLFSPRGQVYDPRTERWAEMRPGLSEGWTGSSAIVHGRLFVISEHEGMRVKVYDVESDSWEGVDGSPLPHRISRPLSIASYDDKLFVVSRDLQVAIGHVRRQCCPVAAGGCPGKCSFSIRWHDVAVDSVFQDLMPYNSQILFG